MTQSYTIQRALIIDDDEINNFICIKNIRDVAFAEHASFCLRAKEALDLLKETLENNPDELPDVIFLDINMPIMNAWEFLEEYKPLQETFPKEVFLFILSSSVYRKDVDKSSTYNLVKDYLIKPLNREKLADLVERFFS